MDAARLQHLIDRGRGIAAIHVGYSFDIYRATSAVSPLAIGNKIGALNASFSPGKSAYNYKAASDQKNALWVGLFDGSQVQQGDYLVNADHGTYFVAATQDILPPLCMECTHIVSVHRSAAQAGVGFQTAYAGDVRADDQILGSGIPAAMQFRREGQKGSVGLPADGTRPTWDMFMPKLPFSGGAVITDRDYVVDENGRRYQVVADYMDDQGYYLRIERVEA